MLKYPKSAKVEYAVLGYYKNNEDDIGGRDTHWVDMPYLYDQDALEDEEVDTALDQYEDELKGARAEAWGDILRARERALDEEVEEPDDA